VHPTKSAEGHMNSEVASGVGESVSGLLGSVGLGVTGVLGSVGLGVAGVPPVLSTVGNGVIGLWVEASTVGNGVIGFCVVVSTVGKGVIGLGVSAVGVTVLGAEAGGDVGGDVGDKVRGDVGGDIGGNVGIINGGGVGEGITPKVGEIVSQGGLKQASVKKHWYLSSLSIFAHSQTNESNISPQHVSVPTEQVEPSSRQDSPTSHFVSGMLISAFRKKLVQNSMSSIPASLLSCNPRNFLNLLFGLAASELEAKMSTVKARARVTEMGPS